MLKLPFGLLVAVSIVYAGDSSKSQKKHSDKSIENNSDETDVPKDPEFCDNRDDGLYVTGCSQKFTRCYNKATYSVSCPHNLYYDYLRGQCEYKKTIKECQHEKQYRGRVLKTPPDFVCGDRTNGLYAREELPCDRQFFSCDNGIARKMSCPDRQYFDEGKQRCEFANKISACKSLRLKISGYGPETPTSGYGPVAPVAAYGNLPEDAPTAAPLSEDIKAVEVEKKEDEQTVDCHIVGDGVYAALSKCSDHFWKCANHRIFKYKCHKDLFYDSEVVRCDHKEFIPECGGTRPETTPTPENSAPVKIDFDCTGKGDGYHTKELCTRTFYSCMDGFATDQQQCPDNLVYDVRVLRCDFRKFCRLPPTNDTNSSPTLPVSTKPLKNNFCSAKINGVYPVDRCSAQYVSCWNGISSIQFCPHDLFFHSGVEYCDYAINIEGCTDIKKSPVPQNRPLPATTLATMTAAPVEKNRFCQRKNDGAYADGCKSHFYVCIRQSTKKLHCGGQLFYNAADSRCDHKELVPECGATTTTTTTTQATPVQTPGGYGFPAQDNPSVAVEKPYPFCERLEDGAYGEGCEAHYYNCVGRTTYRMNCPAGLFYSVGVHRCDLKENIDECGGNTPKTTTPAPQVNFTPSVDIPAKPNKPTKASFDCSGKKDGLYDLPECTASFVQCYKGAKYDQECAGGLFYNVANGMCDYKENVVICGGSLPTTTVAPVSQPQPPVYVPQTQPATGLYGPVVQPASPAQLTETKPNFNCADKKDGFYNQDCSRKYYSCSSGAPTEHTCPTTNVRFSQVLMRCDLPDNIPECGGTAPTVPPTPEGVGAQPEQPQLPIFDCTKMPDGYHAFNKCSSHYVVCQSGNALIGTCQNGLIYKLSSNRCQYKENVAECNPQQTQPNPVPTKPVLPSVEPTVAVLRPNPKDKCANLANGHYVISACATSFMICKSGISTTLFCPQGQIVNHKMGKCDQPKNVVGCTTAPVAQSQPGYGVQTPVVKQPNYGYQSQPSYPPPPPIQTGYGMSQKAPVIQPYGSAPVAAQAPQYGYQQQQISRSQGYGK